MWRDEIAKRVSLRHLTLLRWRYPELLRRSAIRGYQRALPLDIALLRVQDLARVGPIDLVLLDGHAKVILGLVVVKDYVTLDLVCFGRCCACYTIVRHIRHVLSHTFWKMYLYWVILGIM
jgi:hypothetical protein